MGKPISEYWVGHWDQMLGLDGMVDWTTSVLNAGILRLVVI